MAASQSQFVYSHFSSLARIISFTLKILYKKYSITDTSHWFIKETKFPMATILMNLVRRYSPLVILASPIPLALYTTPQYYRS